MIMSSLSSENKTKKIFESLPKEFSSSIEKEEADSLEIIVSGLKWAIAVGDLQKGASFYIRSLDRFISYKIFFALSYNITHIL